eukprot:12008484-Ditylum_brightwellii.AAC.1
MSILMIPMTSQTSTIRLSRPTAISNIRCTHSTNYYFSFFWRSISAPLHSPSSIGLKQYASPSSTSLKFTGGYLPNSPLMGILENQGNNSIVQNKHNNNLRPVHLCPVPLYPPPCPKM